MHEPADTRRPFVSVPGLHDRHQPRMPTETRRFFAAFMRTVEFPLIPPSGPSRSHLAPSLLDSQPSAQDPSQHSSSSAPTLLDPTSGSFPHPSGTHPCSLAASISHKVDGTQATPSSKPRSWRDPPGDPETTVSLGLLSPKMPDFAGLNVPEPHRKRGTAPCRTTTDLWAPGSPFAPPCGPLDFTRRTSQRTRPCPMRPWFGHQPSHSGLPVTSTCPSRFLDRRTLKNHGPLPDPTHRVKHWSYSPRRCGQASGSSCIDFMVVIVHLMSFCEEAASPPDSCRREQR